jgi:hypothetical protein
MATFFQKLRTLGNSDKEDYLTEIFAFALEIDSEFRTNFLKLLPIEFSEYEMFSIQTQVEYQIDSKVRRPDIEINLGNSIIIIECKIDSEERDKQLLDYSNILINKHQSQKLLIYLTFKNDTKDFISIKEALLERGIDKNKVDELKFKQLRFFDIANAITNHCNSITKELKQYLFKEKLVMEKFGYEDMIALKTFFETSKKMNSILLDEITNDFVNKGLSKYATRQPTIWNNEYIIVYNYGKKNCNIALGFGNWWGEHPCLFVRLYMPKNVTNAEIVTKELKTKLKSDRWKFKQNDSGFLVETTKKMLDLLGENDLNQRQGIIDFFKNCIDDLLKIKADFPQIFNFDVKE